MAADDGGGLTAEVVVESSTFGLLIAGRPVWTDFVQVSEGKYVVEVPAPASISEIAVFLLPGCTFPDHLGITVMAAPPPYTDWATLGVLHAGKPSVVMRTGWPALPQYASAETVQIGLSVDPIDTIANISEGLTSVQLDRLAFAQLVARDLYRYLASFSTVTTVGERIVMPTDAVDKWMAKFEAKYRADPDFLLRYASAGAE